METEVAGAEVDGWKLNFLELDLARTAFQQLDVVGGRNGGYSLIEKNNKGGQIGWISRFASSDTEEISANSAARKNDQGFDVKSLYLLPDFDDPTIHLSLRRYESQDASLSDCLTISENEYKFKLILSINLKVL